MKRSEMIDIIFSELHGLDDQPEVSRRIMEAIEQAGMTPPAIKEPCESFVLHNGQYIKVEDSFVFTHKWDDENET